VTEDPLFHVDQLQTDLEENAGNWTREVKPLMRQGKHILMSVSPRLMFRQLLANTLLSPVHVYHRV